MINSDQLLTKIQSYNKFSNPEILTKAFNFALDAHKDQKRVSGAPYIVHPIAVADILTELKLDSATIITGLLHDTIEDTHATYDVVLKEFGKEVADLVDGVTKISALEEKAVQNSRAENFRKLILATSKDIRVLLVKIADRLHNMRTLNAIRSEEKKLRIAKETMEIYAPLADRMGMNSIRDELEDLSFSVLNPQARNLIIERLKFIKNNREDNFRDIAEELISLLKENGVKATFAGREKTAFSIWRKMQNKKISLEHLTDIIGFRVIVENISECYKTLGIFHSRYAAIPFRFKDYISTPKINKYQSIHTAIIGPKNNELKFRLELPKCMILQKEALRLIGNINHQKNSQIFLGKSMTGLEIWLKLSKQEIVQNIIMNLQSFKCFKKMFSVSPLKVPSLNFPKTLRQLILLMPCTQVLVTRLLGAK